MAFATAPCSRYRNVMQRSIRTVLPLALLALVLAGCFGGGERTDTARAAAVSFSGYAWDGQASGYTFKTTTDQAAQAGLSALRKHGFMVEPYDAKRSGGAPKLRGKTKANLDAEINLQLVSPTTVDCKVKVGSLGDRTASETILESMRVQLERSERSAPPPAPATKPAEKKAP